MKTAVSDNVYKARTGTKKNYDLLQLVVSIVLADQGPARDALISQLKSAVRQSDLPLEEESSDAAR